MDRIKWTLNAMPKSDDRYLALTPPMTWAQSVAPTAPTRLDVERTLGGDNLSWSGAIDQSDIEESVDVVLAGYKKKNL